MVVHDCAAVAALRATYVKSVLRPTKMKKTLQLSLPPPFPATALLKMLPILKMMPKTMPDVPIPEDPVAVAVAEAETKPKMTPTPIADDETETETETKPETTKQKEKMKMKQDEEDKEKKKKMEEDPPKAPGNDIGVSPIDHPGYPEDGINFHPPPPSPIALHLQGPFPDG